MLLGLCGYTLFGNLQTSAAVHAHRQSLALDSVFSEARNSIALEEVDIRHYQVAPSEQVRVQFVQTAGQVTSALTKATHSRHALARADAGRLLLEQRAYRESADRLIDQLSAQPNPARIDQLDDAPYRTLQADIDTVSRAYHATSQGEARTLSRVQRRLLAGTVVGFSIGLALVAVIWRVVLGYQRKLVAKVAESRQMALHDSLTELPNRVEFTRRLTAAAQAARTRPGYELALMILDLNGFKAVNDTLGHQAGDQLLVAVGQRLREAVRDGDLVARLGGDEFAVLLPEVEDVEQVRMIAERINDVLRRDFGLTAGPAAVSGSIGVVIGGGRTKIDEMVRHADTAMYRAKSQGGGVAYYDPRTDLESPDRMGLFAEMRALLASGDPWGELGLYYQPQVRISDGTVTSLEALVRWHHSSRGLLMPEQFLPLAETRGLEIPLTYHLLDAAVEQAVRWYRGGSPKVVSVNVSPRCILDDDFVAKVHGAIDKSGLPPRMLRLEVTEGSVMTEPERAVDALRQVHARGVLISVDDYGTGFSSLAQLKRLPADELKIDQSFVREITTNTGDEVLVRSTITLAHDLGMSTVAEGVEDMATLQMLGELGCDFAQGFAVSPPVPAIDVPAACRRAEREARRLLTGAVSGPR